jgi:hypothetical protein
MSPRTSSGVLAVMLLAGAALLGVGAVLHPVLAGDAASQLRTIAEHASWRAVHLAMLAGSGLVATGIWLRIALGGEDESESRPVMGAALVVISLGVAINALNSAYMAGSGLHLAQRYAAGDAGAAALFDATHPIGLMAARFGNFIVALGAMVLGVAEWARAENRTLAVLAWIAAAGGLVGVLFFDESSRATLGAIALLSGWELMVVARALRASRAS